MIRKIFPVIFLCLSACSPPPDPNRNEYRTENRYPQDFKTTGAFLVLERNGKSPEIMASGNLADKKKGIFRTAKHFTDEFGALGVEYCKVFFNGKVYKANLVRVPPIRDAALIRLVPPFSSDDFPDPIPIASEMPKIGDKVYIQGFHPHAYKIRQENKEEGFLDKEVNIFETYYGQVTKDMERESQVVFDNLEGRVVKSDPDAVRKNSHLKEEEKASLLSLEDGSYMKILTIRDHKFSFGGLSGGIALNEKGEAVGEITAQDISRFEYDERGQFIPELGNVTITSIKDQLFDTMYVTPLDSIKELEEYIKNLRD